MNTTLPNKDVADLLAPHTPVVRNLALAARSFASQAMPDIPEQVDAKGANHRLRSEIRRHRCMLMPAGVRVNLGAAYAMELRDPAKLLEGTGNLNRQVKLKSKADLQSAH